MIRVLIVDDSPVVRHLLIEILSHQPDLQVVGYARDGKEALYLAERLKPDLIVMDILMPEVNGVEATQVIMETCPTPILVMSGAIQTRADQLAFDAIQAGALSIVIKPKVGEDYEAIKDELLTKIRLMSQVRVTRRRSAAMRMTPAILHPAAVSYKIRITAIGSSTGGPAALRSIFSRLPSRYPVPIAVVQHMTPGFIGGMAEWLSVTSPNPVKLAEHAEPLRPGTIYIAPEGFHMGVTADGKICLEEGAEVEGARPSINRLFATVADSYGPMGLGVLLTGMGNDGVDGLSRIKTMGGKTIAQDESTSVVFGMPQQAIQAGAVDRVLRIEEIPQALVDYLD